MAKQHKLWHHQEQEFYAAKPNVATPQVDLALGPGKGLGQNPAPP